MPPRPTRSRLFTLRDGRQVTLRAVRETDADAIEQAFERLSKESRYARFMHHKPRINPQALDRGVHPKPGREFVLVATVPSGNGIDIVGAAQFVPADATNTTACEFAVTVAEDWRAGGLAKELLASLIRRARHDGYATMEGYVLADNLPMLALAKRLKFTEQQDGEDPHVTRVRRSLGKSK